jgi:hypothetical protein
MMGTGLVIPWCTLADVNKLGSVVNSPLCSPFVTKNLTFLRSHGAAGRVGAGFGRAGGRGSVKKEIRRIGIERTEAKVCERT